jgi:hypothetical protein
MTELPPTVTFRTGFAASRAAICLSGAMDAIDPTTPYSRVFVRNERAEHVWRHDEHDFLVPSICTWRDPATPSLRVFAALGEDGQVVLMFADPVEERILGAGLHHESSIGYGYLNEIKQIGGHLYACGFSGQVYRRDSAGDWVHMDEGLLQSPDLDGGEYFVQSIDGPHERAIYAAGSVHVPGHPARADFWNGERWTPLTLPPTAGRITRIFVESPTRVWMCGDNGTVLSGNAAEGFRTMTALGNTDLLLSITKFQDVMYVGSNVGLFRFDPERPDAVLRKVETGLQPELADANVVQAVDDVLWSMGPKDIARFDGTVWERFDQPDNPRIGG